MGFKRQCSLRRQGRPRGEDGIPNSRQSKSLRAACRKANQWAKRHASVFDPKKYGLCTSSTKGNGLRMHSSESTRNDGRTHKIHICGTIPRVLARSEARIHPSSPSGRCQGGSLTTCTSWPRGLYVGCVAHGDASDLLSVDYTTDFFWHRGMVSATTAHQREEYNYLPSIRIDSEARSLPDWRGIQNDGCGGPECGIISASDCSPYGEIGQGDRTTTTHWTKAGSAPQRYSGIGRRRSGNGLDRHRWSCMPG